MRIEKDDASEGYEDRMDDASRVELGHVVLGLAGREHAGHEAALVLHAHALLERAPLLFGAREKKIAPLPKPDVDLHLAREVAADADAFLHQAHVRLARPLRATPAAVAPAATAPHARSHDDDDV